MLCSRHLFIFAVIVTFLSAALLGGIIMEYSMGGHTDCAVAVLSGGNCPPGGFELSAHYVAATHGFSEALIPFALSLLALVLAARLRDDDHPESPPDARRSARLPRDDAGSLHTRPLTFWLALFENSPSLS